MSSPAPAGLGPGLDVLCVGLLCVDLVLSVPRHPGPDEKIRAHARRLAPGGPAAVAAVQVARLGGRAAFAGLIGPTTSDPFAAFLRAALVAAGIDDSPLLEVAGHPTPVATIWVKPDASRSIVSHQEFPAPASEGPRPSPVFPPARVLLTDGHRPEWTQALLAHKRARNLPLVLDAGSWTDSVRALAPHAGQLVASEACARAALGGVDPAHATPASLRTALLAAPDATVVVTLGARGVVWSGPDGAGALPAHRIDAVDTSGAGDAFHGAYALGLSRGLDLMGRLRLASAAGALACTRPGAWDAAPTSAELERLAPLPWAP